MSSSGVPTNPSSHNVAAILNKLSDADPDIRFMTLIDLNAMMENGHPTFLSHDYTTCCKVVDGLLDRLNDTNGDVQNVAIKTLGNFTHKAHDNVLAPMIDKVSNIKADSSIDTTVAALAVRAIVVHLEHPVTGVARSQKVNEAYAAVSKALIPRLIGRVVIPVLGAKAAPPKGMLVEDLNAGNDNNSLDLLTEVARSFGPMLQPVEVEALEQITMQILENERCGTVMKKKAVTALSALAPFFTDALLANHVSLTIEKLRSSHLTAQQRKLYLTVYGSLARSIPQKFGPYLRTLAPFALSPLSQEELEQQREQEAEADGERDTDMEEVREAALVAIESFLQSCASDVRAYTRDVLDATTRFLKYEPNVAEDDDEDMEEEQEKDDEFEVEEDFEEETGFEDEDDVSWKVRRCSAKVLHALIQTLDANDPALYGQIAPALIARFKEREESVRTEVIATLAFLITKTGATYAIHQTSSVDPAQPPSRKRRRGFSDTLGADLRVKQASMNGYASPSTPPPVDNATQGLANIIPEIVKGAAKLLKTSTVPTKQAIIAMLKNMIVAQHGGLSDHADLVIDPVIETMSSVTSSATNLAGNSLRIEGLQLLKVIAEMHSSKVFQPHLAKIIPALVNAAKERFAKVASEAFTTIEVFVKALTPPRATGSSGENARHIAQLFQVTTDRVSASETDTEVRQKAVYTLGLLIGWTSGSAGFSLLSKKDRFAGQQLIADRLRNELTRLACVHAVDTIVVLAQSKDDFKPDFVAAVAVELGAQLRKASRSLRGASLSALRMLVLNQASRSCLNDETVTQLIDLLVPLLRPEDLHMMSPTLIVLAALANDKPALVTTPGVIAGICTIVKSALSGSALDALLTCVESIGKSNGGQPLMQQLLAQGVQGDTDVAGQVIGTLLVSGGQSIGVTLDDFFKELKVQPDEARKCLALSVLGEAGLRLGMSSPLGPERFMPYFTESEKVKLAAAVALGRAGAGNVKAYLPKILDAMTQGKQYLLLHSVKELLQHSNAEDDIRPYTAPLWQNIINSGQAEDNKVVGAECIGRLAIIDPAAYLPQLQTFLQNPNPRIRGMVMTALRYVFSDTDAAYNINLQSNIIPMLTTMLSDTNLDNERLSLSTLNSALHNKPDLVLPHLAEVMPYAMQATVVRPELVRDVQMGPFKHKVDDGLELRKSAYETLYALLESSASRQRIDIPAFYDRIVAGIADEHDIKTLCCLVLGKLLVITPSESTRRLDSLASKFRAVLSFKPKDNAVKQELEKLTEANKAVIKTTAAFNKALNTDESRAWREYVEYVKKDFQPVLKAAEEELKESRER